MGLENGLFLLASARVRPCGARLSGGVIPSHPYPYLALALVSAALSHGHLFSSAVTGQSWAIESMLHTARPADFTIGRGTGYFLFRRVHRRSISLRSKSPYVGGVRAVSWRARAKGGRLGSMQPAQEQVLPHSVPSSLASDNTRSRGNTGNAVL